MHSAHLTRTNKMRHTVTDVACSVVCGWSVGHTDVMYKNR